MRALKPYVQRLCLKVNSYPITSTSSFFPFKGDVHSTRIYEQSVLQTVKNGLKQAWLKSVAPLRWAFSKQFEK